MWIATAQRSRDIDRIALQERGFSSWFLMERASDAVYRAAQELVKPGSMICVICGKGNNGGDGLTVARMAHQGPYRVVCFLLHEADELSPDARYRYDEALRLGVPVHAITDDIAKIQEALNHSDLIVDALLGTGSQGEVKGRYLQVIKAINAAQAPVVSVDIPSGIDCDSGTVLGEAVQATRTVTFGLPKPFLFLGQGPDLSGDWSTESIGLPSDLLAEPTDALLLDAEWTASKLPQRKNRSNKGDHGSLLVVAGSWRYPGAAALAVMGAVRSGAGLVTLAAIPSVCESVARLVPEAIFLPLPECDGADLILNEQDRFDAAVFGPGCTTESDTLTLLRDVWAKWQKPCLIDADGLNALSRGVRPPNVPLILTPHPGEAARLLGWPRSQVVSNRFGAAGELASRFNASVVMKGANSVITDPNGGLTVNSTGNSGMATAGMGDVLAGIGGTLLSQGLSAQDAIAVGAFWHGAAGDRCATEIGAVGFTASDLATRLPTTRDEILSQGKAR